MSSTAVPAAPAIDDVLADLALQTRRLRLAAWIFGVAGMLVTAVVAGLPGDLWRWRLVSVAVGLAIGFAYSLAVRPLWRLRREPVLTTMPSGFATAASPRHHAALVYLLAAAGYAWGVGGYGATLGLVLLAASVGQRPARIVITPGAVLVRRLRTRRVPWAQLAWVRVTSSGLTDELSLAVDRPGSGLTTVRARLDLLDIDPAFLVHLLRHYHAVPEDRTAIGAPAELARRRALFLGPEGADARAALAEPDPADDRPALLDAERAGEGGPPLAAESA
ncbi:hypothetical protein [Catellatospora vulcania]|uniref:hypothetical protein n=1 Tax=Catellatospora vulcania TaxID=1460450 RepID=UPI0012D3C0D7|nr:hypothetical protein [Catellatospora vulcania]